MHYPFKISHLRASIFLLVITASTFNQISANSAKKLEKVTDDEFLKLVQTEKYVVALFSK